MAGGKTNTQRIETLEGRAETVLARIEVHEAQIKGILEVLKKGTDVTEGHTSKITVIEQQLLVLVDLKGSLAILATIDKDIVALKKDVEGLSKWREELKKERDEAARRLWAFGPNVVAAVISGMMSLAVALLVLWLNRPR
jgi:hypothetical protein